jgi:5-methyltetrahydropteroyltriglutamate--homocysteine methyltransferase
MTVCVHLCRGNFKSAWVAQGGYEPVAEILLNEMKIDGFFLEYDDERSGDFAPLRFAPKSATIVLGLMSSKKAAAEPKDEVKRRIEEATRYVALDQLCLSPQCGFASTEEGNVLSEEEQWAKLRMIVELADEVWR